MSTGYIDSILKNTYINNFLLSKHICNSVNQLDNTKFVCKINALFFTRHKEHIIIIFWILTTRVGKLFKIKFHKKKKQRRVGPNQLAMKSVISFSTKLGLKNFRLLRSFIAIVPFDRIRKIKKFRNKLHKSKYSIRELSNVRKTLWWANNHLLWSYVGIVNEYDIMYLMKNLDFGDIPFLKILFKFYITNKNKNIFMSDNVKKSMLTLIV